MSRAHSDTRNAILRATLELLEANDGAGVRMSDIAKRAGISRQAVYLHFATRAELLIAATHHVDELKGVEERLSASRAASSGVERLEAYIEAWGNYIPEIHPIARALLAMRDTDEAAAAAWDERMQAMRDGCRAAIVALKDEGALRSGYSVAQATDLLWTLLSVRNWEQLTARCGWSQRQYIKTLTSVAREVLVERGDGPETT